MGPFDTINSEYLEAVAERDGPRYSGVSDRRSVRDPGILNNIHNIVMPPLPVPIRYEN